MNEWSKKSSCSIARKRSILETDCSTDLPVTRISSVCSCYERAKGQTPWEMARERARRTRIRHGVIGVCAATRLFGFHSLHEDPPPREWRILCATDLFSLRFCTRFLVPRPQMEFRRFHWTEFIVPNLFEAMLCFLEFSIRIFVRILLHLCFHQFFNFFLLLLISAKIGWIFSKFGHKIYIWNARFSAKRFMMINCSKSQDNLVGRK